MSILSTSLIALCIATLTISDGSEPECKETLDQFGKVEIEGGFAHDLGCKYRVMKINGKKYTYQEGTSMLAEGYVKEKDTAMLVELIDVIYLQHSSIMTEANKRFGESKEVFTAPKTEKAGSGYRISAWVFEPAQSLPIDIYVYVEFTINASGDITKKRLKGMKYNIGSGQFEE